MLFSYDSANKPTPAVQRQMALTYKIKNDLPGLLIIPIMTVGLEKDIYYYGSG